MKSRTSSIGTLRVVTHSIRYWPFLDYADKKYFLPKDNSIIILIFDADDSGFTTFLYSGGFYTAPSYELDVYSKAIHDIIGSRR